MVSPQRFTAKLEDKIVLNEQYIQLTFELIEPHTLDFIAGQYVSIQVTPEGLRRSYSICSAPDINHGFELMVDINPGGPGTTYLNNLKFGEQISLLGPMGKFIVETEPAEPELVFIATGSGVAPFRSMILDLLQSKKDSRPLTLLWGLRYANLLFWQDELSELQDNFVNFKFHPVLSRPSSEWSLCSGHVTDCLAIHETAKTAGYYICGNQQMIADVVKLLEQLGVNQTQIHFEKFN